MHREVIHAVGRDFGPSEQIACPIADLRDGADAHIEEPLSDVPACRYVKIQSGGGVLVGQAHKGGAKLAAFGEGGGEDVALAVPKP